MVNYPEEMKQWFESHDFVKSADCQIFYIGGEDGQVERTVAINRVLTHDDELWIDSPERVGGDYRDDPGQMMAFTSKRVFNIKFGLTL